jgi:FtsP/CotA-like multicopper oxidase with cupredoxin domain
MHLHLVQFQLINRQNFQNKYTKAYNAAFPGGGLDPLTNAPYPPGVYIPGFGPPKNYDAALTLNPLSGGKFGGNPNITPYLGLAATPPLPEEAGWKDTVVAYPGQVTRLAVRYAPTDLPIVPGVTRPTLFFPFDPSGGATVTASSITGGHGYVWHCHIIDHEDNEMMRPNFVTLNPDPLVPLPANRPLKKTINY